MQVRRHVAGAIPQLICCRAEATERARKVLRLGAQGHSLTEEREDEMITRAGMRTFVQPLLRHTYPSPHLRPLQTVARQPLKASPHAKDDPVIDRH